MIFLPMEKVRNKERFVLEASEAYCKYKWILFVSILDPQGRYDLSPHGEGQK